MSSLKGKVAIVTGGSRGIGKGVALGLGEAGVIVYITGRTVKEGTGPPLSGRSLPGTISQTAEEVTGLGGQGIAVRCDHRDDAEVATLFQRVREEQGRLDILVNNVYSVPETLLTGGRFWELPISVWDETFNVALRSHYVASTFAAPIMLAQGSGLIVNISSSGGKSYRYVVAYGVEKAANDRLAADMAEELRPHNIAAVSIWPGLVRTERTMRVMEEQPEAGLSSRLGETVSPQFIGRAVVSLATDSRIMERSGQVVIAAELAAERGFTDIDGRLPLS